jgi:hypothetical protein
MSDLPKYSYASTADLESAPLMSGERNNGWSKSAPVPASQGGNIAQGSSSGGQRHNVLYVFEPVYPLKGEREQVVGLLGRSREVSSFRSCIRGGHIGAHPQSTHRSC